MDYQPGDKVVYEVYKNIVIILRIVKPGIYMVRGWDGKEFYNWVAFEHGIRPLTDEEDAMDFDEWETDADFEGGLAYCEAAIELALFSRDQDWFYKMWARKRMLQRIMQARQRRQRRNAK